jgi:hypothetical protein
MHTGDTDNLGRSHSNFGLYFGGEFAASPNDCGLFLNGVGGTSTNRQCPEYDAWDTYNATMKEGIQHFVMAMFDVLENWFFWTWKVQPSHLYTNVAAHCRTAQIGPLKPAASKSLGLPT